MPSHLDFLLALDDHLSQNGLECVHQAYELHSIAHQARLTHGPADLSAARWTGQLISLGYMRWGLRNAGDPLPVPTGVMWTPDDVQRFSDYYLTPAGREEAQRMRLQRREALTDAAIGGVLPKLIRPWMTDAERRAVSEPLASLRTALDARRGYGAIGAAKDLVEAASKLALARGGQPVPKDASLPSLFRQAAESAGTNSQDVDVGRRLAAVVQALAELRNVAGAGHGRAEQREVSDREARLAATAAAGIALYLLDEL